MSQVLMRIQKWTVLAALVCASAAFAVPKKITFQGKLLDNTGKPVNNSAQPLRFSIYNTASGGTAIWTDAFAVSVVDGIYTVVLGSISALNLPFNQDYYLGIRAGADAEMTPRVALSSVGYAFRADTANFSAMTDTANYAVQAQSAGTALAAGTAAFADSARISGRALRSDTADVLRNMPSVDSVRAARKADSADYAWNSNLLAGYGVLNFVQKGSDTARYADSADYAWSSNLLAGYGVLNFVQKGGDTARYADSADYAWNANTLAGYGVLNFVQRGDTRNIQLDSLRLTKNFVFEKGAMDILKIDTTGVVINSGLSVNNSLSVSAGDLSLTNGSRILLNGREIDPGYEVTLDTLLTSTTNSDLTFNLLGGNVDIHESYFEVKVMALDYNSISAHTFEMSIDGGSSFEFVDTTGYNRPYFLNYEVKIWNSIRYANLVPVEFSSSFYGLNDKAVTLTRPGGGLKEVTFRTNAGFQVDTRVIVTRIKR